VGLGVGAVGVDVAIIYLPSLGCGVEVAFGCGVEVAFGFGVAAGFGVAVGGV
jgi:hypothetical protein